MHRLISGLLLSFLIPISVSAASIPQGAQRVSLLSFTLQADCDEDAIVQSVTVKHAGLGSVADIQRVYVVQDGKRISSAVTISRQTGMAVLRPRALTIAACTSQSFRILADFSPDAAAGGLHRFTIKDIATSAGDVHLANAQTDGSVQTTPGEAGSINVMYRPVHGSVTYGRNRTVARVQFESDASFDQRLTSVTFTNNGSAKDGDLQHIRLYDGETLIAPAVSRMDGDRITFTPDASFVLKKGQTVLLTVKADVRGRAKRTINLVVDEPSDIEAVRQQRSR